MGRHYSIAIEPPRASPVDLSIMGRERKQCECGQCRACQKRARRRDPRIIELRAAARSKQAEIAMCALLAGAEPVAPRPIRVTRICVDCGGAVFSTSITRCQRCAAIRLTRLQLERYLPSLTEDEVTQRALYRPLDEPEVAALALCDDGDSQAQEIMNSVIVRETERIRSRWTEHDYAMRSGKIPREFEIMTSIG